MNTQRAGINEMKMRVRERAAKIWPTRWEMVYFTGVVIFDLFEGAHSKRVGCVISRTTGRFGVIKWCVQARTLRLASTLAGPAPAFNATVNVQSFVISIHLPRCQKGVMRENLFYQ